MRDSTPEVVTGPVRIALALDPRAGHGMHALAGAVSNWIEAVNLGFFGPARTRVHEAFEEFDRHIVGVVDCDRVPQVALDVLSRMGVRVRPEAVAGADERVLVGWPKPPPDLPFDVEYPDDLRRFVRVEIEFRRPVADDACQWLFCAFATWDRLIEAAVDPEWAGQESDCGSRRLGPRIVEHEIDGYYATFECLRSMVWFGLRVDRRLAIARLTIE